MTIQNNIEYFNDNLRIKINNLISEQTCQELILRYKDFEKENPIKTTSDKLIKEYANMIFTNELDDFLLQYFDSNYLIVWSSFDIVDSTDYEHNYSTKWHLDGGVKDTLKLFIYLNPVSEHNGNTIMIDRERTIKIAKAGKLPIENEKREINITPILKELELSTDEFAYDLEIGDALLFSPLLLAHKCLPPKENKKRYTICFTIVPKK